MTAETQSIDFSQVGGGHFQAAVGSCKDNVTELEWNRYDWLWEMLHDRRLTDMISLKMLANLDDRETMELLTTWPQGVASKLKLAGPQAEFFQKEDLPRLTKLLKEAHRFAHDTDAFNAWASRPNR